MPVYDDDDLGGEPDDFDDADDDDDDDDEVTVPCPACGGPVYDDAERCPGCGHYLSREDAPWARPAWWVVAGVAAALVGALTWVVR